jgi:single-strand DNA-binding protein|tara:strand:+ start:2277 stop:2708 length:432 start_codon:yes stop_codon:yes gene_type:complete
MKGINKAIILGYVWKEPTIRSTKNGNKIAQVDIVTESGYGEYKKADWHKVIFYGKQADVVDSYVNKGTNLYVEGSIDYRKYTGKDGIEKYTTDIKGQMLQMINSPDAYKEVETAPEYKREVSPGERKVMKEIADQVTADDIPF